MTTSPAQPTWTKTPIAGQYVNSVSTSADGTVNAAGTYFETYGGAGSPQQAPDPPTTQGIFVWDGHGNSLWSDTLTANVGFYWVSVSRDGSTVAGGGEATLGSGFVNAYDAKGHALLTAAVGSRTNMVAMSDDGTYLVAGADQLYLYTNGGSGFGKPSTLSLQFTKSKHDNVISVGISSDGAWIAFSTLSGYVGLVPNNTGTLGTVSHWNQTGISVHWVSLSADGSAFVAGGTIQGTIEVGAVYFFTTASFPTSTSYEWTMSLSPSANCRNVAIRDNGGTITAIGTASLQAETALTGGTPAKGYLYCISDQGTEGTLLWSRPLVNAPNATSMDSAGDYVAAADGYPDGTPGQFYLFDSKGNSVWTFVTGNMSWPIQISANANAVLAGSDDSNVYFFTQGL